MVTDELIETLWNVNTPAEVLKAEAALELIETLWNVNFYCSRLFLQKC